MGSEREFAARYFIQGKALIDSGAVKEPFFSRGAYQVEIQEKGKKKFFPFLQINEQGGVIDAFCSCKESEDGDGCPHLAAAYQALFNDFSIPLHIRFERSFWNALFRIAAERYGFSVSEIKKGKEGRYFCHGFSIVGKGEKVKERLKHLFSGKNEEIQDTSLKLSNWSLDEISQLKEGRANDELLFELSFWADLAKWILWLSEKEASYHMTFDGEPYPSKMKCVFPFLEMTFELKEWDWISLISTLHTVKSSLKAFNQQEETIEKVEYLEGKKEIHLIRKAGVSIKSPVGYPIGNWIFVQGEGFYERQEQGILSSSIIATDQIPQALSTAGSFLKKWLKIEEESHQAHYELQIDELGFLHIFLYLFHPHDLEDPLSTIFAPWIYKQSDGFYFVDDLMFEAKETVIPPEGVSEFINKHRVWLQNFPGFEPHVSMIESQLSYQLTKEDALVFQAELKNIQDEQHAIHFDEWIYIPGVGFYMKQERRGALPIHPGKKINKSQIGSFIETHKEELQQVHGFFKSASPLEKIGLVITVDEEGKIHIEPHVDYASGIDPNQVKFFGSYVFLDGFFEIPAGSRLPPRYQEATVIPSSQEMSFINYELDSLSPYILQLDPKLKKPLFLKLQIHFIAQARMGRGKKWVVDASYVSDLGSTSLFSVWEAVFQKKKTFFSSAGLLNLKHPRFHWLKQIIKKRWNLKKQRVTLTTLEWMRLSIFETIQEPHGKGKEYAGTKKALEELQTLDPGRIFDLTSLKATLRPYQEQGVLWLWFLYCHGLSGLLCDDMGLGKTHQAMALLAAIIHEDTDKKYKYLVVCPTSVIYHWQELLSKFLPSLRVCTYYGLERSLTDFSSSYDLLLTSYGILRTGKEAVRYLPFEIAIFDEIQIAKNHASQTHKALRALKASMKLGLTGTPIENRVQELKALFDVVLPSYLPPDPIFREAFVQPIEKENDEEKKKLLHRLIQPFVLRRKKSDVLKELPEKIEEIAYADLSLEQKELYRKAAARMKQEIYPELKDASKPVSYVHIFSVLTQLKQICDHPSLILKDAQSYTQHHSGKWDLFVELLSEARASGQKVVVFSQYLDMLMIMESYLKKQKIGFASIKGSTKNRSGELKKFREDPACEVFLASLLAAGVGIDLTVASIVIHYDRWWNPAKENQATDRVHRIGQNRGVQVFKLVTKNTVEEHIHQLIEKKKGLFESVIKAEDQITYLSREELISLCEQIFAE